MNGRFSRQARKWAGRFLLAGGSLIFALLLCEAAARLAVSPADYLEPELSADGVLGHRILPHSGGHDAWGFRNREVPDHADIVAIGDSLTYGVSASAAKSWPAQLARLADISVYNLGLGGYGPAEYESLLRDRAARLTPKAVVTAVYLGNDLHDAYSSVYGRPGREEWRAEGVTVSNHAGTVSRVAVPPKTLGGLRNRLARHSVLYRMATFAAGDAYRKIELERQSADTGDVVVLYDAKGRVVTGFFPAENLEALDTSTAEIQEGIRLTAGMLAAMRDFCRDRNVDFSVVLLPTKESVYWPMISRTGSGPDARVAEVVAREEKARALLEKRLDECGVKYADLLADLRAGVEKQKLYFSSTDEHPNGAGYGVIAEGVARLLPGDR